MHKLSLNLDQLSVESFDTVGEAGKRAGTVRGYDLTQTTCGQFICDCPTGSGESCQPEFCDTAGCESDACGSGLGHTCVQPSCFNSCPGTCGATDPCFC